MGLPQLLAPNPTGIVLDLYSVSWIRECRVQGAGCLQHSISCSVAVSLSQTSRVLGFFISGAVAELLGRRRTIIAAR